MYRIRSDHSPSYRAQQRRQHVTASLAAVALGLLTALALGTPATFAADTERMSDARIEELVEHRLAKKDLDDVDVRVTDARVALSGTTQTLHQLEQATRIAERTDDVQAVQNTASVDTSGTMVQDIAAGVSKAFRKYPFYSIFDWIEADVRDREVVLSGSVHQPWRRDAMLRLVKSIPGVTSVDDQIDVQPPSAFDDGIRSAVANAIYSDTTFFGRGDQLNPPVHIIVNGGKVRLEGVVRNEAERRLARSLASFAAVSIGTVENNLKTSAEVES